MLEQRPSAASEDEAHPHAACTFEPLLAALLDPSADYRTLNDAVGGLHRNPSRPRSGLDKLRREIVLRLEENDLSRTCMQHCWSCDDRPRDAALAQGNCVTRLAVLVGALRLWDADACAVLPELHAAWQHTDTTLSLTARGVLAQLGETAALEAIVDDLDDPQGASTALMQFGAAGPAARPYLHHLILRFDESIEWARWMYLDALGSVGGPLAIDALRRELALPYGSHDTAIRALEKLGPDALHARTELETIASEHPSAWTRRFAGDALRSMGIEAPPSRSRCPRAVQREESSFRIHLRDRTVTLRPVEPNRDAGCLKLAAREHASLAHAAGGTCIIGASHGEFGGWLAAYGAGPPTVLARDLNPQEILVFLERRWLLTGLSHMGVTSGLVYLLATGPSGGWEVEPFARLPGKPIAWGVDSSSLLLLIADHSLPGPEVCPAGHLLVRVGPNGEVEALE